MVNAIITGWGASIPERVLTNRDLESMVNTNDEWIVSRTGIRERHIANPDETAATLGLKAAQLALAKARIAAADLDLVIFATTTPDYLLPASGCLIQQRLGAEKAGAFDLNAACSGFLYGLSIGSQYIKSGCYRKVLVICSEVLTRFVNWTDRGTCILFGDGAAAIVLEASEQDAGLLSSVLGSRGDVEKMLLIEAGGGARPASSDTVAGQGHTIRMRGNEVFKYAVRNMDLASREALKRAGLTLDDIKVVIPHQANLRILNATQASLGFPPEKMFVNIDRYGNTGAASIPIALCEYLEGTPPQAGDHFLFAGFGGGLTWGSAIIRWADLSDRA